MTNRAEDHAAALAAELRILSGKLKRRLREQGSLGGDISWSQFAVLRRLEQDGPATVSALARAEGMRSQSMGAITAALEAAGLVDGMPHPTDGRQTLLTLTAACREKLAANRAARQDWLCRAIQAKLAPEEQDALAQGITLLQRLVEP
jgi:DNA-binding MarR family transcriptional regulator